MRLCCVENVHCFSKHVPAMWKAIETVAIFDEQDMECIKDVTKPTAKKPKGPVKSRTVKGGLVAVYHRCYCWMPQQYIFDIIAWFKNIAVI